MSDSIRVLVVDDSENDALLLTDALKEGGYDPVFVRVDTKESMCSALREQPWDVIVADYTMPDFSGREALDVLHSSGLDIPLILVSGTAEEHTGVDMMLAGASDFVVKHNLSRLVPAVRRELREAESRRRRRRAEDSARMSAENYRMMFEYAPAAIVAYDHDGIILRVNPVFEQIYGLCAEDAVGRRVAETLGHPAEVGSVAEITERVLAGKAIRNAEWKGVRRDGEVVYLLANMTPVCNDSGETTMALAMISDITESKLAEQHMKEFYRRTISAFTGGKLVISEPEQIAGVAGGVTASWILSALEDLEAMRSSLKQLLVDQGMDERRLYEFIGAVVEAVTNAYKHAGGGIATLHLHSDQAVCVVADTGGGIEALSIPDVALTKGYSTKNTLGMGYTIMIESADRVYLATGPEGTVVGIEMGLRAKPSGSDSLLQELSSRLAGEADDDW